MSSDKFRRDLQKRAAAKAKTQGAAPVKAPPRKIPMWQGCLLLIVAAIAVGGLLIGILLAQYNAKAPDIWAHTGLFDYCNSNDIAADCDAWADDHFDQYKDIAKRCDVETQYPTYRATYFACLRNAGV